jgi:hypothetical protein
MCHHSAEIFYLPFVSQSNPNIKVHETIFTFHLTLVKPGRATTCANLIVFSVDTKLNTFVATA